MTDNRYRLVYGETHNDLRIADDEKRNYMRGFPVELLNEQDKKIKIMEEKLEELGFELWFSEQIFNYDKETKKESQSIILTKTPDSSSVGEWVLISKDKVNKYEIKGES